MKYEMISIYALPIASETQIYSTSYYWLYYHCYFFVRHYAVIHYDKVLTNHILFYIYYFLSNILSSTKQLNALNKYHLHRRCATT
jgi:hypothetical protein